MGVPKAMRMTPRKDPIMATPSYIDMHFLRNKATITAVKKGVQLRIDVTMARGRVIMPIEIVV